MHYFSILFLFSFLFSTLGATPSTEPIVTAQKYMEYKKKKGHLNDFIPPKIVLVCYQQSTLNYLLEHTPDMKESNSFPHLYLIEDGKIGVLGGWGLGAPALAIKMEELIALECRTFIAVGTAGALMNKQHIGDFIIVPTALAEDGVAHLYLQGTSYAKADEKLFSKWTAFTHSHSLSAFHRASAWSFSAIFRETPSDIARVISQGYDVVDMEAATLYAIGQNRGAQTLSLFVISDSVTQEEWIPHIKDPLVKNNLHKLADWALTFCQEEAQTF